MSKFTDLVKKTIPSKWVSFIGHTKDWFDRLPELPEAYFHPIRRDTIQKVQALKDLHKGERCFIIGNGPSLKKTDLAKLRNEYTFGMNRFYLAFQILDFKLLII